MSNDPKLIELLTAAYTYLDRFVDVEQARADGFDLAAWCREADALRVPPRPCAHGEYHVEGLDERGIYGGRAHDPGENK